MRMVPRDVQRKVLLTYRPGQCDDKRPSGNWISAAKEAIEAVYRKENGTV